MVDTSGGDLNVPADFVEDDRIVLNVSPGAVRDLDLGNDHISFKARFSGKSMDVYFPIAAVLAIYARENGRGMIFPEEEQEEIESNSDSVSNSDEKKGKKKKGAHLKVIK